MCPFGVPRKINRSDWGYPTFTIQKKDGTLRSITDLQELNKRIKRKPFSIPKIQDMLQKLEGFMYASSLDLNMGYNRIESTPNSSRYCTIVLPGENTSVYDCPWDYVTVRIFSKKEGEIS